MAYYCLSRCKREILIGVSCPNEIPAWNIFWHDIERIEAACSETECVINFLGICLALTFIVYLMCNFNNRFPSKVQAARRTLVQHLQLNSPACTSACLPPSLPALRGTLALSLACQSGLLLMSATAAHGIKLKCQVSCYFRRQSYQTLPELQQATTPCQIACYKFCANQIELGILCNQPELLLLLLLLFLALLMCTWPNFTGRGNSKRLGISFKFFFSFVAKQLLNK